MLKTMLFLSATIIAVSHMGGDDTPKPVVEHILPLANDRPTKRVVKRVAHRPARPPGAVHVREIAEAAIELSPDEYRENLRVALKADILPQVMPEP